MRAATLGRDSAIGQIGAEVWAMPVPAGPHLIYCWPVSGADPLVVRGLRHGHRPSRHDSASHRRFGSGAVSAKQLKVAWDIIHRAGGSEVIRYENGNPISMGVFSGRNDAWGALGRDREVVRRSAAEIACCRRAPGDHFVIRFIGRGTAGDRILSGREMTRKFERQDSAGRFLTTIGRQLYRFSGTPRTNSAPTTLVS